MYTSQRVLIMTLTLALFATGCAGHMTMTQQNELATSQSIFLEPTDEKTIYVESRNASNNQDLSLANLSPALEQKGYTVTSNPQQAHFLLQTNAVYCDEAKAGQTMDTMIAAGWGGALGAGLGSLAYLGGGSGLSAIPGLGLIGAGAGALTSIATEDTYFLCAVDVQIQEATTQAVQHTSTSSFSNGNSQVQSHSMFSLFNQNGHSTAPNGTHQPGTSQTLTMNKRTHQTRIVSQAQKMWLDKETATKSMSEQLAMGIANIFP